MFGDHVLVLDFRQVPQMFSPAFDFAFVSGEGGSKIKLKTALLDKQVRRKTKFLFVRCIFGLV